MMRAVVIATQDIITRNELVVAHKGDKGLAVNDNLGSRHNAYYPFGFGRAFNDRPLSV